MYINIILIMNINIEKMQTEEVETKKMDVEKKKLLKKYGLFMKNVLTRKVLIPFENVGSNIKEILENLLRNRLEGKCVVEGYIKPDSVEVINFSSGIIKSSNVEFDVMINCLVCCPPEGMVFNVKVINITKAGLRCQTEKEPSPVDVFVARDHNYDNKLFNSVKVDDIIKVRVLGQRYEINDEKISVIATIIEKKIKTIKIKK